MVKRILIIPVYWLTKFVLWLRYRVHVEGLEDVRHLREKVLVLPNHPAFVDPPMVLTQLWRTFHPRPMVWQGVYENPAVGWLMWLLDSVVIPDMDVASREARQRASLAVEDVIKGLQEGKNHILWPSGRLMRDGAENLGSARAVHDILKAVPDVKVVVVRTEGLWGSGFSYAYKGELPNLTLRLLHGIGTILANLIFFVPRRRLRMTIAEWPQTEWPEPLSREAINTRLEAWYNANGYERAVHRSYHFLFGSDDYDFPPVRTAPEINLLRIKPPTKMAIRDMLEQRLERKLGDEEYQADVKLEDLDMDSLDRMELTLEIERRFRFHSAVAPTTIAECWALAQGLLDTAQAPPPGRDWQRRSPKRPKELPAILGETIPEAFVRRALEARTQAAVADDTSGALTYERLLVGAHLLARRLRSIEGPYVGLLLPATVASEISFLALHLAGKIPVMLNWTTGPSALEHAVRAMGLSHVVTSRQFIDRTHIEIKGVEYLFLEDLRKDISPAEKVAALARVRYFGQSMLLGLAHPKPDEPAVILFTSGSEKAPKAVPLTHRNMLSNIRAAIEALAPRRGDSLLGFLPPFHSFGLVITSLLPVLGGLRVVHHPDPTDAGNLVRKVAAYQTTLLIATPTFLGHMLERADPGQLDSVRLAVVGAEACPAWVFERFAEMCPHGELLEGYGVTECAPVVSANRPGHTKRGSIGTPLPGVEVRIVEPESYAPLSPGERGLVLVHGDNVFPGYLGEAENTASTFCELDGKRYYVTGDLASVDEDGFIFFKGRMKRFLKHAGEMVSLPALEAPLAEAYPSDELGPRVAVEGIETERGEAHVVLFTRGADLSLQEANEILTQRGLRGVLHLKEVRPLVEIPLLGTGKTDYKVLRRQITEPSEPVTAQTSDEGHA